ncbi:SDR family NAD(P)-dependent oxidoreductase [Roseomonas haemaphysalidis]|uniref:SDR family oxidoreductase n=1 Tax=Roseomonas haemaphysalidis TaxID=2768162 RepID=A0ABS3KRQ4_9PROT|nr:SDR family oxidoreductase [Roseomonas haemaphysalidis]MBO1080153.1 SDR family oxidoreductase [Roseomonas haemaphysalidis]
MMQDRVVIVTGGGRGLGLAMAEALLAAGARVTITGARAAGELQAAAARFPDDRLLALTADVTRPEDCARTAAATLQHFGALHAVVNNAGRGMRLVSERFTTDPVPFWTVPPDIWASIIDINLNGAFNMAAAAMPHLLAQRDGRIVNVSTSDQTMVRRGYAPYGPSKAGLEAASRCWAQDVEGTGVTVNVLLPGGAANTELLPGGADRRGADGNLLDPALMGPPAVWLCSAASAAVNGGRFIARLWDAAAPEAARSPGVAKPAIM